VKVSGFFLGTDPWLLAQAPISNQYLGKKIDVDRLSESDIGHKHLMATHQIRCKNIFGLIRPSLFGLALENIAGIISRKHTSQPSLTVGASCR